MMSRGWSTVSKSEIEQDLRIPTAMDTAIPYLPSAIRERLYPNFNVNDRCPLELKSAIGARYRYMRDL